MSKNKTIGNNGDIVQISQDCVEILARLEEIDPTLPVAIIDKARFNAGELLAKGSTAGGHTFFTDIGKDPSGWRVQYKNRSKGHYRLLDGADYRHASVLNDEPLMIKFFTEVCEQGFEEYSKHIKMQVYEIVDGYSIVKKDRIFLTTEQADKAFPHSTGLTRGVYTEHPKDKKALVPIADYFTNLFEAQTYECFDLLRRMGAKKVHITGLDNTVTKRRIGGSVGVKDIGSAKADAGKEKEMVSSGDYYLEITGEDKTPPEDILETSIWFRDDKNMHFILEACLACDRIKQIVTTKVSSDEHFDFNVAARILGLVKADLEREYTTMKNKERTFEVEF